MSYILIHVPLLILSFVLKRKHLLSQNMYAYMYTVHNQKISIFEKKIFFALCTTKTIKGFQRYETNVIINLRA